ncbi:MAG: AAA family ATPase [Lentisphaeria bacterium]|nr:ATP-binding protein [Lentisphaerota bacterium]
MKFELENYGPISNATVELGDLTIICGRNNTGKTCIAYAIYDFIKFLPGNVVFRTNSFKSDDQNSCRFDLNSLLDEAKEATKKACVNFAKSNHAGELKCVGLL